MTQAPSIHRSHLFQRRGTPACSSTGLLLVVPRGSWCVCMCVCVCGWIPGWTRCDQEDLGWPGHEKSFHTDGHGRDPMHGHWSGWMGDDQAGRTGSIQRCIVLAAASFRILHQGPTRPVPLPPPPPPSLASSTGPCRRGCSTPPPSDPSVHNLGHNLGPGSLPRPRFPPPSPCLV
eukprot:scaffold155_cov347-Pavlova_lutheri.AAC.53